MNKKISFLFFFVLFLGFLAFCFNFSRQTIDSRLFAGISESDVQKFDIDFFTNGIVFSKDESSQWLVASKITELQKKIQLQDIGISAKIKKDNLPTQELPPKIANQRSVAQTLELILALRQDTLVSTNPDKQSVFEISPDKASITIHLRNKEQRKLLVGKSGPVPYSTFVRLSDSTEVYLVSQNLGDLFNHTLADWTQLNTESTQQ